MPRARDEGDAQMALDDRARLADLAIIETDEFRRFGGKACEVGLAGRNEPIECGRDVGEVRLHRRGGNLFFAGNHQLSTSVRTAMIRAFTCRSPEALALPSIPMQAWRPSPGGHIG